MGQKQAKSNPQNEHLQQQASTDLQRAMRMFFYTRKQIEEQKQEIKDQFMKQLDIKRQGLDLISAQIKQNKLGEKCLEEIAALQQQIEELGQQLDMISQLQKLLQDKEQQLEKKANSLKHNEFKGQDKQKEEIEQHIELIKQSLQNITIQMQAKEFYEQTSDKVSTHLKKLEEIGEQIEQISVQPQQHQAIQQQPEKINQEPQDSESAITISQQKESQQETDIVKSLPVEVLQTPTEKERETLITEPQPQKQQQEIIEIQKVPESPAENLDRIIRCVLNIDIKQVPRRILLSEDFEQMMSKNVEGRALFDIASLQNGVYAYLLSLEVGRSSPFSSQIQKIDYLLWVLSNCIDESSELSQIFTATTPFLMTFVLENDVFVQPPLPLEQIIAHLYGGLWKVSAQFFKHFFGTLFADQPKECKQLLKALYVHGTKQMHQQMSFWTNPTPFEDNFAFLMGIFDCQPLIKDWFILESELFYSPHFQKAQQIQNSTPLGLYLSVTSLPRESDCMQQYANINVNGRQERGNKYYIQQEVKINEISYRLDSVIQTVLNFLNDALRKQEYRKVVLEWLEQLVRLNASRTKSNYQNAGCATDGFQLNLLHILLLLFEPLMREEANFSQLFQKIDIETLFAKDGIYKGQPRLVSLEDSQINQSVDTSVKQIAPEKREFATRLYALVNGQLSICTPLLENYLRLEQADQVQGLWKQVDCFYLHLFKKSATPLLLRFLSLTASFQFYLNRLTDGDIQAENFDFQNFTPEPFYCAQPLFYLESVVTWMQHLRYFCAQILLNNTVLVAPIYNQLLIILGERKFCSNPHLRVNCGMFFVSLLPPNYQSKASNFDLSHYLSPQNPINLRYLMPHLFKIFIDSEHTGRNSLYYEMFDYRIQFMRLFTYELREPLYQDYLRLQAKKSSPLLLEFLNLYLNSIIHHLDDTLTQLEEVRNFDLQLAQLNGALSMDEIRDTQELRAEVFQYLRTRAVPWLNHYYDHMEIISRFTRELLICAEIRDKVVRNMNYTVIKLSEPSVIDRYKINSFAQLQFNPNVIISKVMQLYLNLQGEREFRKAVVADERFFDTSVFRLAFERVQAANVLSQDQLTYFARLLQQLIELAEQKRQIQQYLLEDIPEEFLDPLLGEIMLDPVKLPSSAQIVDRVTISQHLLNDKTDPYNRAPLKEEDLIPQIELKQRIREYINNSIATRRQKQQEALQQQQVPLNQQEEVPTQQHETILQHQDGIATLQQQITLKQQDAGLEEQEILINQQQLATKQTEEVLQNQEEDSQKQEEVLQNQEEVLQKQEEDSQKQEEVLQKQEEDSQNQEEVLQNQEEVLQNQEENSQNQEEVLQNQEDNLQNQEEVLQNQEEVLQKQEDNLQNQEEDLQNQEEVLKKQEEVLQKQEDNLQKQEEDQHQKQQQEILQQQEEVQQQQEQILQQAEDDIQKHLQEKAYNKPKEEFYEQQKEEAQRQPELEDLKQQKVDSQQQQNDLQPHEAVLQQQQEAHLQQIEVLQQQETLQKNEIPQQLQEPPQQQQENQSENNDSNQQRENSNNNEQ